MVREIGGWIAMVITLLSLIRPPLQLWAEVLGGPYLDLPAAIFFCSGDGIEPGVGAEFVRGNFGADVHCAGLAAQIIANQRDVIRWLEILKLGA